MSLPSSTPTRFDVGQAVSLSRLRQSLLGIAHDKQMLEQRVAKLEQRLREQAAATKAAQGEAVELQKVGEESERAREEAEQRDTAQRKAHEDERARHALATRLAV